MVRAPLEAGMTRLREAGIPDDTLVPRRRPAGRLSVKLTKRRASRFSILRSSNPWSRSVTLPPTRSHTCTLYIAQLQILASQPTLGQPSSNPNCAGANLVQIQAACRPFQRAIFNIQATSISKQHLRFAPRRQPFNIPSLTYIHTYWLSSFRVPANC